MKKYYLLIFIAFCLIYVLIKNTNNGTLSAMVVPRQTISDWTKVEMKPYGEPKAFINGEEVNYDAASYKRCDDLYRYYHLIGYGNIENGKEMVYLYKLNLDKSFVTQEELIAIYAKLKKEGKI